MSAPPPASASGAGRSCWISDRIGGSFPAPPRAPAPRARYDPRGDPPPGFVGRTPRSAAHPPDRPLDRGAPPGAVLLVVVDRPALPAFHRRDGLDPARRGPVPGADGCRAGPSSLGPRRRGSGARLRSSLLLGVLRA